MGGNVSLLIAICDTNKGRDGVTARCRYEQLRNNGTVHMTNGVLILDFYCDMLLSQIRNSTEFVLLFAEEPSDVANANDLLTERGVSRRLCAW